MIESIALRNYRRHVDTTVAWCVKDNHQRFFWQFGL